MKSMYHKVKGTHQDLSTEAEFLQCILLIVVLILKNRKLYKDALNFSFIF